MDRKINSVLILSVALSALAIPQILFHWLVPQQLEARIAIYILGSCFTAASAITGSLCCCKYGFGKGMAAAAAGAVLAIAVMAVCAALAAFEADIRTSIFALSIFFPLYIICLLPLVVSAWKSSRDESALENNGSVQITQTPPVPLPPRRI